MSLFRAFVSPSFLFFVCYSRLEESPSTIQAFAQDHLSIISSMAVPRIPSFAVILLCFLWVAHAVVPPRQSTTQISGERSPAITATITQPSTSSPTDRFHKRQFAGYVCGTSGSYSVTCIDNFQYCQGIILQNGEAYAACGTDVYEAASAIVTTAYTYPGYIVDSCPAFAACWYVHCLFRSNNTRGVPVSHHLARKPLHSSK